MEDRVTKTIIKNVITTLQILTLTIPIVLQYLADKKMGVKRYLVFKKMILTNEIFTSKLMFMFKFMLFLGVIIGIVMLISYFIKKKNSNLVKSAIRVIILNFLAIAFIFSKQAEGLLAYHFFLIAIFIIITLQYLVDRLNYKREKPL
jgi:4-amino-4-deoxy-L-arabinose transferase-like glycosyltransferase